MVGTHVAPDGAEFFDLINTYLEPQAREQVYRAFALAREEHGDERRQSGELFFTHPLTIAYYLAEYQLDASALVAALLHDVVEDTRVSVSEIETMFGREVARLVDALTKFEAVADKAATKKLSKEEVRDATLHKLFGMMTDDLRVGIIKLFDRLHNMRTIGAVSPESQKRKAEETLAVYAPLANRLGMWQLKNELEALSLQVLDNEAHERIQQRLEQMRHQHQLIYATVSHEIAEKLTKAGLQVVDIKLNPENVYSIYRDSRGNGQHGSRFKLDDIPRLVVVLKDVRSCYVALGELHQLWRPIPGSFDDYIATPRDNLYRSLHTTVIHSSGRRIKVRFRTVAMNLMSEIGVLARWLRTGLPLWSQEVAQRVDVLFDNISENINLEPQNPRLGVQTVMQDVFRDQIMVYTPAGDVKELPKGATALDFAYTIHSEVGAQCRVALVNDQPTALNKPLQDGDRVQIIKRGNAPQRIWLDEDLGYLATGKARTRVRRWFRRLSEELATTEGKRLLQDELTMLGFTDVSHEQIAGWMECESADELYHSLGRAEVLPTAVSTTILEEMWQEGPSRNVGSVVCSEEGEKFVIVNAGGRPLRLCRMCQPRPDDDLIGFARTNGSVTVHKAACRMLPVDPLSARKLKLSWGTETSCEVRLFTIKIDGFDRAGLLFEITKLIQSEGINMPGVHAETRGGTAELILEMEVSTPRQMVRVLHRIYALVNVYSVACLPPNDASLPETRTDEAD